MNNTTLKAIEKIKNDIGLQIAINEYSMFILSNPKNISLQDWLTEKEIQLRKKWDDKIKEIAETHHDRLCMSVLSGIKQTCGCCEYETITTTVVEHDSRDYSKDLRVCNDCYSTIMKYWKANSPRKIPNI